MRLKLEELEKPVPGDDEALIEVRAASVNPFDYHMLRHPGLRPFPLSIEPLASCYFVDRS